jgi:PAS domain S-box-containing protein
VNVSKLLKQREQIVRWVTDPVVDVAPKLLPRIRLLTGITFLVPIIGVMTAVPYLVETNPDTLLRSVYAMTAGVLCMTLFYLLARWGYYASAAWGTIITINATVLGLVVADTSPNSVYLLVNLLIPILLGSLLFNVVTGLILTATNLLIMALLPVIFEQYSLEKIIVGPSSSIVVIGMLLLLIRLVERHIFTKERGASQPLNPSHVELLTRHNRSLVLRTRFGEIIDVNHAGARYFGLPDKQFIMGQRVEKFVSLSLSDATIVQYMVNMQAAHDGGLRTCGHLINRTEEAPLSIEIMMMDMGAKDGTMTFMIHALDDDMLSSDMYSELQASEQRYRTVSELMSDYAYGWRVKSESKRLFEIDWITGAFEAITGYKPEAAKNWQGWILIHPEDVHLHQSSLKQILAGQSEITELRIITKSGDMKWVRDYARPIFDANGHVKGIYGAVRDITSWYEAETALRMHALQQAVVAELGQRALMQQHDVRSLFNETVMLVAQAFEVPFCSIVILDEQKQTLVRRAAVGWEHVVDQYPMRAGESDPLAVYTIGSKEPCIVVDSSVEDRFDTTWMREQYHIVSAVAVPILVQHKSLGTLGVYSQEARKYSPDDINFLQAIANVIASCMEQASTAKSEIAQRNFADALSDVSAVLNSSLRLDSVMDRVLSYLSRVLPHDSASIMMVEHETLYLVEQRSNSSTLDEIPYMDDLRVRLEDLPVVLKMVETQRPLVIPDVQQQEDWKFIAEETTWIRSYVGAPIVFQGELLGILNVDSATPNRFRELDAHRLQAFANQASIAIHNARRAAELEEHVRQRTQELDLEHRRLQTILDATGEGICYVEEMVLLYANRALCQMTGYYSQELEKQPMSIFFGENSEIMTAWQDIRSALINGDVLRRDIQIRRKDGSTFDAGLTISLADVHYEAQSPVKTAILVRDISQQKLLDEQRSRFIANASHELRSPIASMNTRIYMMRRDPDRMTYHVDLLERVVDRMNVLVEDLLDTTRFEQGTIQLRKRDIIIQPVVSSVIEIMKEDAARKNITLITDIIDDPLRVFADPDRIQQVLTNLIANAINYTAEGGKISVQVVISDSNAVHDNGYVHIVVKDTGIGIAQEDLQQVFKAFFRAETGTKGMGLGLNIAREIMLHHDGDITVESMLGEGSTFTILIPMLPTLTEPS